MAIDKAVDRLQSQPGTVAVTTEVEDFISYQNRGQDFKINMMTLLLPPEASGNNSKMVRRHQQTILSVASLFGAWKRCYLYRVFFFCVHRLTYCKQPKIRYVQGNMVWLPTKRFRLEAITKRDFERVGYGRE